MEISQKLLALSALYACLVGMGLGVLYDFFRIFRAVRGEVETDHFLRTGIQLVWIFIEDMLYALLCAAVVIVFVFHVNQGRIRGFMLLSAGIGFWLYYITVGRLMIRLAKPVAAGIRWGVRLLITVIVRPLLWMKMVLYRRMAMAYTIRQKRRILRLAADGFVRSK